MQDRYLFRGRRLDNREWVIGYYCKRILGCMKNKFRQADVIQMKITVDHIRWIEVDPTTVGQCTGLLAANSYRGGSEDDKLIFEGDIVKNISSKNTKPFSVGWNKRLAHFNIADINKKVFEIVGNIYEHPELLGGVEK